MQMASTVSRTTVGDDTAVGEGPETSNGRGRMRIPWKSRGARQRTTVSRIPQLDLLRAVAILLVIGRHLGITKPEGMVGVFAEGWYRVGWMGVDLFFVLSGFLIAGLLINETKKRESLDIRRFLVRRGMKIYPLYFLFVGYIILAPVAKAVVNSEGVGTVFSDQISTHWPNLFFIQNYVDYGSIGHLWSIAVEEHFYLLLPLVVAVIGYHHAKKLIWVGVAGVFAFLAFRIFSVATGDRYSTYVVATHLRLDGLLFGVALRAALEFYPERFARIRRWRVPLFIFGLACWAPMVFVPVDSAFTRTVGLTLTLLGAAAFLLALYTASSDDLGPTRPVTRPVVRLLCWVGVFSYGIYLWHVTAAGAISKVTNRTIVDRLGEGQLSWLLSVTVIVVGAVGVGILATMMVERPLLRWRDRIAPSRAPSLPTQEEASEVATPAPRV